MTTYPYLGAGVGLRRDHYSALAATERRLDWLEFISENYMFHGGRHRQVLLEARDRWPLIPHGVSLDIGGQGEPNPEYLDDLARLAADLDAPFVSDHLCLSRVGGTYTHELIPLPFRAEVVEIVARRAKAIEERVGRPLLLENATYYVEMPGGQMDEAEFLCRIVEESGCGLLLDVNNAYVNSVNHGYDPRAFLERLPLDRVGYVHLAGHRIETRALIDDHGSAVPEPVWDLYRFLLERTGPISTLVEWDANLPELDRLLEEADRARSILAEFGAPALPTPAAKKGARL
ncbi:MAG: DUF692 domain-containing protein [Planctomycetes bacterium]|nr:DUF692 domain-containing protein [Planctomycetota bacterium]